MKVILLLLLLLTITNANAFESSSLPAGFSILDANKKLENVETALATKDILDKKLYESVQKLEDMQGGAAECAKVSEAKLKKIDGILSDPLISAAIKKNPSQYNYLVSQKDIHADNAASCKLFLFKTSQLLSNYAEALRQQGSRFITRQSTPVWGAVSDDVVSQFNVSTEKLYFESGINLVSQTYWLFFAGLLIVSFIVSKLIYNFFGKIINSDQNVAHLSNHISMIVRRYIYALLPITTTAVFFNFILFGVEPVPIIVHLSYAAVIYIGSIAIANYFLSIPMPKASEYIGEGVRRLFFNRFLLVSTIILLGYLGAVFLRGQALSQEFVDITRITYLTALMVSVFWFAWVIFKAKYFIKHKKSFITLFGKISLLVILFSLIIAEWMGYHYISTFMLTGVILTIFFLIFLWGVILLIESLFSMVNDQSYQFTRWLRYITNVKYDGYLYEFYLLRVAIYILLGGFFTLTMMETWEASLYHIDLFKDGFFNGFPILGIKIIPIQIAAGIAIFCGISLMGRVYAGSIAHKKRPSTERDSQVAIATVVNYIFFAVGALVALLVAGVNFTGLAIIAGALSFGIGFGLQNIANDILSGLILLIQKPIKSGDRVVVCGIEGFVKRVRVISTQIKSLDQDDVIVPNHKLLADAFTNGMFRDKMWRVVAKVGVEYGSDIDLVKKLLLEIAKDNNEVLINPPNAPFDSPSVLFQEFGDSALLFELWVIIEDVNRKYPVLSDLNFEIDKRFRKHNIVIAFPQVDLHVKEPIKLDK